MASRKERAGSREQHSVDRSLAKSTLERRSSLKGRPTQRDWMICLATPCTKLATMQLDSSATSAKWLAMTRLEMSRAAVGTGAAEGRAFVTNHSENMDLLNDTHLSVYVTS